MKNLLTNNLLLMLLLLSSIITTNLYPIRTNNDKHSEIDIIIIIP